MGADRGLEKVRDGPRPTLELRGARLTLQPLLRVAGSSSWAFASSSGLAPFSSC